MSQELEKQKISLTLVVGSEENETGSPKNASAAEGSPSSPNESTLDKSPAASPSSEAESKSKAEDSPISVSYSEQLTGKVVAARYQLDRLLGSGGMSVVYQGRGLAAGWQIAFKVMHRHCAPQGKSLQRFLQEGKALSKLDNRNIVKVYEYGVHEGATPYMVMEYVDGKTLSALLEAEYKLSVAQVVDIAIQMCNALEHAHMLRVIHRDLKPSNIIVKDDEFGGELVKIVDFGIAKIASESQMQLTNTGEVFGSPLYMSPEQCFGGQLDQRTDLYSLGCIMYECLTGAPPIIGDSLLTTMMLHQQQTPLRLREATLGEVFPEELERITAKLLAKAPEDRYRYAGEVKFELENLKRRGYATCEESASVQPQSMSDDFFKNIRLQSAERHGLTPERLKAKTNGSEVFSARLMAQLAVLVQAAPFLSLFGVLIVFLVFTASKGNLSWNTPAPLAPVKEDKMAVNDGREKAQPKDESLQAKIKRFAAEAEPKIWNGLYQRRPVSLQASDLADLTHWENLAQLDRLRSLNLTGLQQPPPLQHLSKLHLNSLKLSGTTISGGLASLAHIPGLLDLDLSRTEIRDSDLAQLNPSLRDLNLSECTNIDDRGVDDLLRLKHLRNLNMSFTSISSESLQTLAKMHLERLDLSGTNISRTEIDDFRLQNPNCVVTATSLLKPLE